MSIRVKTRYIVPVKIYVSCITTILFFNSSLASNLPLTKTYIPNFEVYDTNFSNDFTTKERSLYLILPSNCNEACQNYVYLVNTLTSGFRVINLVSKPSDGLFLEQIKNVHTNINILEKFRLSQLPALIVHDGEKFKGTYEGFLTFYHLQGFTKTNLPLYTRTGYKYSNISDIIEKYNLQKKDQVLVFESSDCTFSKQQREEVKQIAHSKNAAITIFAYGDLASIQESYKNIENIQILNGREYDSIVNDLDIRMTPTSIVIKNGEIKGRIDGYEPNSFTDTYINELGL